MRLLKNIAGLVKAPLPDVAVGRPIEFWFQHEARVGRDGVGQKRGHAYIWAQVGSRPRMVRDNQHASAFLFGAICPDRAVGAAIITSSADTWAMNLHLKEISTQVAFGAHALLVCDGAGWHQRGKKLHVHENITLLSLPAYSPELNPMQNVWDYLRPNKHCEQVWDTYDDIVETCEAAWRLLITDPERIRSIGSRKWACVSLLEGWYKAGLDGVAARVDQRNASRFQPNRVREYGS
jgi:hypothetical protein